MLLYQLVGQTDHISLPRREATLQYCVDLNVAEQSLQQLKQKLNKD